MVSGVLSVHLTFATVYRKKTFSPLGRAERNYQRD